MEKMKDAICRNLIAGDFGRWNWMKIIACGTTLKKVEAK
jgi:hypothetical protein